MKNILIIAGFAGVFLGSCSTAPSYSEMNFKMQEIKKLADSGKISNAEKGRREFTLVRQYEHVNAYDEAYWASVIANYELYDKRKITLSQLNALNSEAQAVRVSRQNSEKALRTVNCISARQKVDRQDYSGVNSTNGVVAVVSLLAAVSDGIDVANKCDN
jgi:hypothetical protein